MHILYLTQSFPPEPGATRRPLEQARVLKDLGHDVTVVTAFPSYPSGRFFPGVRRGVWRREVIDGLNILRVWSTAVPGYGLWRRCLAFATFALSATCAGLMVRRPAVVIASVPFPLAEFAAWMIARLRRAFLVIELRDVLPDSLLLAGLPAGRLYRMLASYFGWIYRRSDALAIPYEWMRDSLNRHGVRGIPVLLLPHAYEPRMVEQAIGERVRAKFALGKRFVATYAGSFNHYYRVADLLATARILLAEQPGVALLLVGTGTTFGAIEFKVRDEGLANVILSGAVAPECVGDYLAASDLFIHPQVLPAITDGAKIIDLMAFGKPILNICLHEGAAGQAEELGIGRSLPGGDARALADSIRDYAADAEAAQLAGSAGARYAQARFQRHAVIERFEADLRSAMRLT